MIKKYYEVSCDNCGNPDYLGYKPTKQDLVKMNWIVYKDKHFCCKECKDAYIEGKPIELKFTDNWIDDNIRVVFK